MTKLETRSVYISATPQLGARGLAPGDYLFQLFQQGLAGPDPVLLPQLLSGAHQPVTCLLYPLGLWCHRLPCCCVLGQKNPQ